MAVDPSRRKNNERPAIRPFYLKEAAACQLSRKKTAKRRAIKIRQNSRWMINPPTEAPANYIDELIGPQTVNTMPPNTIGAFRDHGRLGNTLEQDVDEAQLLLDNLLELGIDLDEVTVQLQQDGLRAFANSFDELMAAISAKMDLLAGSGQVE